MDQPQMTSEQPPMGDPAADRQPQDSGYEICIRCDGEGKLSVGVESGAQEAAEGMDGGQAPDDDAGYTPAKDIKEALTMALDIYKSQGKANPGDALGKRLASAGFSAGYEED